MGFGRELRRARNDTLPDGHRLMAFVWCVEMTQPIGFHATLEYLAATVGAPFEDVDDLDPALDSLVKVRSRHQAALDRYAEIRRAEKLTGRRAPPPFEVTPREPRRWHGDEARGAFFRLRHWRPLRYTQDSLGSTEDGRVLLEMIDRALIDRAAVGEADRAQLARLLASAEQSLRLGYWVEESSRYLRASQTRFVLGQVWIYLNGAPALGRTWNFDPT